MAIKSRKKRKPAITHKRKSVLLEKREPGVRTPRWPTEPEAIENLLRFESGEPFKVLGPHPAEGGRGLIIRAFLPRAIQAWVRPLGNKGLRVPMVKTHPEGLFQVVFEKAGEFFPYKIEIADETGALKEISDPYAFFPDQLSDYDLHLIGEGTHHRSYEKLGSHLLTLKGVRGVFFMVWAPNAKSISVV